MIVVLSAEAESDIEAIGDYIARADPGQAISFVTELRQRCAGLAAMPKRFPLVDRHADRGVRRLVYGNYLIFYRVADTNTVVVLHVLHGARDYDGLM